MCRRSGALLCHMVFSPATGVCTILWAAICRTRLALQRDAEQPILQITLSAELLTHELKYPLHLYDLLL